MSSAPAPSRPPPHGVPIDVQHPPLQFHEPAFQDTRAGETWSADDSIVFGLVHPRACGGNLAELARALPANWRRPSKPADLATAPGRNCALFAALCKLALGGSDEGLLTWARTLNSEFAVPLPESEVRGIWRSVCRYRARWRVQGHQQGWLWKQATRGRKGGLIGGLRSGVVRRAGTPLEHDRAPWADLGVSRATWYRRFRGAKTDGENLGAKGETESQYR